MSRNLLVPLAVVLALLAALWWLMPARQDAEPIRIGVVHSLSGTMAISEKPLVDAVTLAVEQINATGGLLGQPIEIVAADGASDWPIFAREAERLIVEEKVSALFACWTSACRKAVKPVVEKHRHLMFYPVQYEGMESSPNILYTGSAPNQQIVPGAHWALEKFGKRVYLVGSDYVFPRTANLIIKDLLRANGAVKVAERYLPLGSTEVAEVIDEIRRLRPDFVLNTVNGDSNAALFHGLAEAGLANMPMVSFSVAEPEMVAWGGTLLSQHFAVWSYFQSIPSPINTRFVHDWQQRFGADRVTSDPIEAAYNGVRLWAQAVRDAGSTDPGRVNPALMRQSLAAPSEIVSVDSETRHLWKMVRIGQVQPNGQFIQVYSSTRPLRPAPWPYYRSRQAWADMLRPGQP